jgi:hypothetical protein
MTAGWQLVIQSLVGGGVFTAVVQIVRAFLARGKAHVDSAEVVQGMALQLVTPFAERLREADAELDNLRKKFRVLEQQLDAVMDRARLAEDELRKHDIPIPGGRRWTEINRGS